MLPPLLVALTLISAEPKPDPQALVAGAAAKLQSLDGFSVVFRERLFSPGKSMRTSMVEMDVAQGGRLRLHLGRERLLLVSNGEKWVRYLEVKNQVTEESDPEGSLASLARQMVARVVERPGILLKNAAVTRFLRWEKLSDGAAKFQCAVVEMRSRDNGGLWTAKLWIDPETSLIRRLDMDKVYGVGDSGQETLSEKDLGAAGRFTRTTTELLVQWKSLEPPREEALFEFTPPREAHRVGTPARPTEQQ